eukprot:snap_masked-scaffold_106-processed-gene-0.2-mRNA-1 protein AED:1.00 eAED:1.00 QI:0/-1/0/0/-1/1/1/0/1352
MRIVFFYYFLPLLLSLCSGYECEDTEQRIADVPRRDMAFNKVSSSIADYSLFCPDEDGEAEICPVLDDISGSDVVSSTYAEEEPNSPIIYVQSLIMLVFIGMLFSSIACCVCCCGFCVSQCGCSNTQTYKRTFGDEKYYDEYKKSVIFTYFLLSLFIFTMVILILMGIARGTSRVDEITESAIDAPDGLVDLVAGISTPFVNLGIGFFGGVFIEFLQDFVQAIEDTLEIETLHAQFAEVDEVLDIWDSDSLTFLSNEVDKFEGFLADGINVSSVIDPISEDIDEISALADNALQVFASLSVSFENANVTESAATLSTFNSSIETLTAELNTLRTGLDSIEAARLALEAFDSSIDDIVQGSYSAAERDAYNQDVTDLATARDNLVEGDDVLLSVDSSKVAVDDVLALLPEVSQRVQGLETAITGLDSTSDLLDLLLDLNTSIASLNISEVFEAVEDLDVNAPNSSGVTALLQEMVDSVSIVDTLIELSQVPERIIDNLFDIPDLRNASADINATTDDLTSNVGELETALQDIEDLISDFNSTTIKDEINQILLEFEDDLDIIIADALVALDDVIRPVTLLNDTVTESDALNFADFSVQLDDLTSSLNSLSSLLDLSTSQRNGISDVNQNDLSIVVTQAESIGTELTALPIQQTYVCEQDGAITCFNDGIADSCATFNECEMPYDALLAFQTALPDLIDLSSESAALSQVETDLTALNLGVVDAVNELELIDESVQSSNSTLALFTEEIDALNQELDDLSTFDLTGGTSTFDFTGVRDSLSTANDTVTSEPIEALRDFLVLEEDFYVYFTQDIPLTLTGLEEDVLRDVLEENGEGGVEALARYIIDILLVNARSLEDKFGSTGLVGSLEDLNASSLDSLTFVDLTRDLEGYFENGGYYYFYDLVLYAEDSEQNRDILNLDNEFVSQFDNPQITGYYNSNGVFETYTSYTENSLSVCVTDQCIRNTFASGDEDALSDAGFMGTTSTWLTLPMLLPAFILFLALLVFCFPGCGAVLGCCSGITAMFFFTFFGGLFFPITVLYGDGCSDMELLAGEYLTAGTESFCNQFDGSINSNGFCAVDGSEIALSLGVNENSSTTTAFSEEIEIDIGAIVVNLFAGCNAGLSTANSDDGKVGPVDRLAEIYGDLLERGTNEMVQDALDSGFGNSNDFTLADNLVTILSATGPRAGTQMKEFIEDLNEALGCRALSNAFQTAKAPVCCESVSALYYITGIFYTMAFAMLFCGMPAGFLARSRMENVSESRKQIFFCFKKSADRFEQTNVGQRMMPPIKRATSIGMERFNQLRKRTLTAQAVPHQENANLPMAKAYEDNPPAKTGNETPEQGKVQEEIERERVSF